MTWAKCSCWARRQPSSIARASATVALDALTFCLTARHLPVESRSTTPTTPLEIPSFQLASTLILAMWVSRGVYGGRDIWDRIKGTMGLLNRVPSITNNPTSKDMALIVWIRDKGLWLNTALQRMLHMFQQVKWPSWGKSFLSSLLP